MEGKNKNNNNNNIDLDRVFTERKKLYELQDNKILTSVICDGQFVYPELNDFIKHRPACKILFWFWELPADEEPEIWSEIWGSLTEDEKNMYTNNREAYTAGHAFFKDILVLVHTNKTFTDTTTSYIFVKKQDEAVVYDFLKNKLVKNDLPI